MHLCYTLNLRSYRKPNQLFVVALHSTKHFLTVALQLFQLLLDDSSIQRLALLYQRLSLVEDVLDLGCSEGDLLLERLWDRRRKRTDKQLLIHSVFHAKHKVLSQSQFQNA